MKLLAGTLYDPTTRAQFSTASLTAMTALDTTNLRLTFTAPSSGNVLVSLSGTIRGATTSPMVLLGVLDGATVKARVTPVQGRAIGAAANNDIVRCQASFVVTGLTGGQSYTWDAAASVDVVVASTNLEWGGPDNTTANDAAGGFQFMIWDCPSLLAAKLYDPGTAVTFALGAAKAMTAFDTTNLRNTFVAPSNGKVLVRIRTCVTGGTAAAGMLLGVLDSATIRCRQAPFGGENNIGTIAATDRAGVEATMLVTGLTGGTTYNWDAAYGCELGGTSMVATYGGPDDTTTNNAWGALAYEVWQVADVPRAFGFTA